MPTRRGFLAGLGSATLAPSLSWAAAGSPAVLSAARLPDGRFVLLGLTSCGRIAFTVPLLMRGHAGAAHPNIAEAVVIARRPGRVAHVIDCVRGTILDVLAAPEGRHFYGHAAFSADGTRLFTTENDIATGQGRVGVWDRMAGYARIAEFPSGGIGPHEIIRLPSGDLAVANGGIRTHPDTGREKLNLATMRPNLSILTTNGQLVDKVEPPHLEHQNSLRHITARPDGSVICGFQWQGDPYEAPALVAAYLNGRLASAEIEDAVLRSLDGYIGSVSALANGAFAATAPRGGRALIFDDMGQQSSAPRAEDICGLAATPKSAIATDGQGRVYALSDRELSVLRRHELAFDNHLVAVA